MTIYINFADTLERKYESSVDKINFRLMLFLGHLFRAQNFGIFAGENVKDSIGCVSEGMSY
jgi:hypothetical protein